MVGQDINSASTSNTNQTSSAQTSKYQKHFHSHFKSGGLVQTESVISKQSLAEFAEMKMKDKIIETTVIPTIVTPTTVKPITVDSTPKEKKSVTQKQYGN